MLSRIWNLLRVFLKKSTLQSVLAHCKNCGTNNEIPGQVPIQYLRCGKCGFAPLTPINDHSKDASTLVAFTASGAGIGAVIGGPPGALIGGAVGLILGAFNTSGSDKSGA